MNGTWWSNYLSKRGFLLLARIRAIQEVFLVQISNCHAHDSQNGILARKSQLMEELSFFGNFCLVGRLCCIQYYINESYLFCCSFPKCFKYLGIIFLISHGYSGRSSSNNYP
jgi:hypothetical protein